MINGICDHEEWAGPIAAEQHGWELPPLAAGCCPDCGRWWLSMSDWIEDRTEILTKLGEI